MAYTHETVKPTRKHMKKYIQPILYIAAMPFLAICLYLLPVGTTGCKTVNNGTNVTTTLDFLKLERAKDALVPAVSSALRRAIIRSPDHADEIAGYARAIGRVFREMAETKTFSSAYLISTINEATMQLQTKMPPEAIDAKNAAIALYKIFLEDRTTAGIPDEHWSIAVCELFYESIDLALKDAGKPGL